MIEGDRTDRRETGTESGSGRGLAVVAATAGNLVEWYDFFAYSFTSLYFVSAVFPKADRTTQLLNAAAIFAVGFFVRPLGAWLFGRIADRRGRRLAMVLSVLLMSVGSLMIACVPTYATIGRGAPALLLLARLVQGVSVGGEFGIAATYMSEIASKRHRGLLASFHVVSITAGQLLALLVIFALQRMLSVDELRLWGWRVPFALGALGAIVVVFLRRSLPETTPVQAMRHQDAGSVLALIRHHRRPLLIVLALSPCGPVLYFTFTTYMQKYLVNTAGMDPTTASTVLISSLPLYMIVQPVFGALSDRVGRKKFLILFTGLGVLTTAPLLRALGVVRSPYAAFGLVLTALTIYSLYSSIFGLVKAELFPPEVRAVAVGLTHAIAAALFGGTAEYLALWFKAGGREGWFAWYVTALLAVGLVAASRLPDTRTRSSLDAPRG